MSGSVNLCVKLHSKLLPVASLLCHQHCADLIFIRSQAHSILLPTDTQPLSKRLKFARTHHPPTCCNPVIHYNKVCPLLWATSLHCWVKEPVSASSGLYTEPKGVMTHSNEDSVLLDPFFLWFAQHSSTTWQTKKVWHWSWFMQSSHSLKVPSCVVMFADCDKPRYIDSSDF